MGFKTYCSTGEFWGAKFRQREIEFDPEPEEVYLFIAEKIEKYDLDEIPDSIVIKTYNCLDQECENVEEAEFEINPFDYLTDEELDDLEKLLSIMYPEDEEE